MHHGSMYLFAIDIDFPFAMLNFAFCRVGMFCALQFLFIMQKCHISINSIWHHLYLLIR